MTSSVGKKQQRSRQRYKRQICNLSIYDQGHRPKIRPNWRAENRNSSGLRTNLKVCRRHCSYNECLARKSSERTREDVRMPRGRE
jgi:hypothetical protein